MAAHRAGSTFYQVAHSTHAAHTRARTEQEMKGWVSGEMQRHPHGLTPTALPPHPPPPPPLPPARLEVGWSSANIIAHALGWPSALASHPFWLLASHLTQ
jgi:hypothetical protein